MRRPQSAAQQARNRLGGIRRHGGGGQAEEAARLDLDVAKLKAHVREFVDTWPHASPAMRRDLALIICPDGLVGTDGTAA